MRSGGLTRYAIDLMGEQAKSNEVVHLYPGKIDFINKKTRIKKNNKVEGKISHWEIINSLPLPVFRGIKEPNDFMISISKEIYTNFLYEINPDVIHIHTLMGLHKEFFEAVKELGIKMIYTTHDYFGICPTINLYKDRENINCNNYNEGKGCLECCCNAMGTRSLLLTQTSIYPMLKKFKKIITAKKGNEIPERSDGDVKDLDGALAHNYIVLREFYFDMLRKIDFFHFNSTLTEKVFKAYLPGIAGRVVDITHGGIKQKSVGKTKNHKIRIGYLGPLKEHKGFFILLDAFKQLPSDQYELHLYGDNAKTDPIENVYLHGRYSREELESIFAEIDVLVVPSVWQETFGFVTLEGLSYGTPVIVSKNVGSKDIVKEEFGWTINSNSSSELFKLLSSLTKEILYVKHLKIEEVCKVDIMEKHSKDMCEQIYSKIVK